MDDIYNNSPLGSSGPTNFVHQVHVGFDPVSGAFTGLPEQWTRLLTSSAITKEDYARNPQAVLDVLEFYTENQKRGDWTATPNATMPNYIGNLKGSSQTGSSNYNSTASVPSTTAARFGAGTGYAGSQATSTGMARASSNQSTSSSGQSLMPQMPPAAVKSPGVGIGGGGGAMTPNSQARRAQDDYFNNGVRSSATGNGQSVRTPQPASQGIQQPSRVAPQAPYSAGGGGASSAPSKSLPSAPSQQSLNGLKPLITSSGQRSGDSRSPAGGDSPASESGRNAGAAAAPVASRAAPPPPSSSSSNGTSHTATAGHSQTAKVAQSATSAAANSKPLPSPDAAAAQSSQAQAHQAQAAAQLTGKVAPKAGAQPGERRISTMTEAQITAKLRSVVSPQDPSKLYAKIKKVGQGASGSVYVAKTLETGVKVAIKQMDLSAQPRKELIVNEILVMKDSKHPNIVNFLDSFLVKSSELWVVMEYMEGGALTDVIDNNTLEEDQISSICFEVRAHLPMFYRVQLC